MSEKFDYTISNPPYQESVTGNNRAKPIYTDFIDSGRLIGEKVIMVHPARFLSNAGQTSKSWNKRILESSEFTVLTYYSDAKKIFPYASIKGGVAITFFERGGESGGYLDGYIANPVLRDIKLKIYGSLNFFRSKWLCKPSLTVPL